MADPCDFTIQHIRHVTAGDIVRIEARDGLRILVRIELAALDFVQAQFDGKVVTAGLERILSK